MHCSTPSPKFHPFRYTISRFQDIAHFRIFPLTPRLKFQSDIKILNFGRSANIYQNFLLLHDYLIYHKVWLRSDQNWRRSTILKFLLPQGPMLMKKKKNHKELKIENFEKTKQNEKWSGWRYGGQVASHKIWSRTMQRFPRNVSLRTDNGCLHHDSSSAV